MLRKFLKLPLIGSVLALLMFGVAVCFGFGIELYRFGIVIPILVGTVFIWSAILALKEGSYRFRICFFVGTGILAAFVGVICLMYAVAESETARAIEMEKQRAAARAIERLETLKAAGASRRTSAK